LLPKLAASVPSPAQAEKEANGRPLDSRPHLLILSTGGAEANRALFGEREFAGNVLLQNASEVATAYQANGTPSGYLIGAEGKIASGLAMGAEALLEFAEGKAKNQKSDPQRQVHFYCPLSR
jgi:hypothetical protein